MPQSDKKSLRARTLATIAIAMIATACGHEPPPASPWQSTAMSGPAPQLALRQQVWDQSGPLNAWYEILASIEGRQAAADLLLTAANTADDDALANSTGARQLVVHAIYRSVQARSLGQRFTTIRPLVDRMYKVAEREPETQFALAYLRWILLSDGNNGLRSSGIELSVIRGLSSQLQSLVEEHPQWDGPGDFDRHRIARQRDAVRELLARELAAESTATAQEVTPTVQERP